MPQNARMDTLVQIALKSVTVPTTVVVMLTVEPASVQEVGRESDVVSHATQGATASAAKNNAPHGQWVRK